MNEFERFSYRMKTPDAAPAPFREALRAAGASETIVVEFPADHRRPIQEIVERAFREKAKHASGHDNQPA